MHVGLLLGLDSGSRPGLVHTRSLTLACSVALLGCLMPRDAVAAPIILEVFYDASASDTGKVFTELYGEAGFSLDGWSLVGINGSTGLPYRTIDLTGAVIPSNSVLLVAQSSANPALANLRDFAANVDWQNGPDAVQLWNPSAMIADALQYGTTGVLQGEGIPASDAPAGSSLTRDLFGTDTNNNFADFSTAIPTPGVGPPPILPTPVPEPSTLLLLGSGLAAIAAKHRRHATRCSLRSIGQSRRAEPTSSLRQCPREDGTHNPPSPRNRDCR